MVNASSQSPPPLDAALLEEVKRKGSLGDARDDILSAVVFLADRSPVRRLYGFYGFVFTWTRRDPTNPWWHWALLLFQAWFNFAGAAMGWLAGYAVYLRFTNPKAGGLGWFDIVLALIAALGIVGHLPQMLAGIASTPDLLAQYVKGKLKLP